MLKDNQNTKNPLTQGGQVETIVRKLFDRIEELSEQVHNAWMDEKRKQGFHSPQECKNYGGIVFKKWCDRCHTDLYPYASLPENIKEYDRVTVRSVLNAIKKVL